MIQLEITGSLKELETGRPLPGLYVKAHDKDLIFDDLLGSAFSDQDGAFRIITRASDFRDFFDKKPDVYVTVYGPDGKQLIYSTEDKIRWNVSQDQFFDIRIPRESLRGIVPPPRLVLAGDDGEPRTNFDVGEPLAISADGLRPSTPHAVTVSDADGAEFFSQIVMSDREGTIPATIVWPQMGFDDPLSSAVYTLDEARERWTGQRLQLRLSDGEAILAESTLDFAGQFERPLVFGTDADGRLRNGFQAGEQDAIVLVHNAPWAGTVRVYLVERRHDWRLGDRFVPVTLNSGRLAYTDVEVDEQGTTFQARIARARELAPGAYDFIVRPIRYGYEDDELLYLRETDLVGYRLMTGLVVREEFMASKFVRGGCANLQQISGRRLSGRPYFQYTNVFQKGEDVWGALDPSALDPNHQSKMAALYVVQHKTAAQWSADSSLTHLPQLGGNTNVIKFKTQTGCINANKRLLWSNANDVGEYDIVADFGNNTSDSTAFAPDATYNHPLDFIDGYVVAGFKIIEDPTTYTRFDYCGTFDYNDGNINVTDDGRFDDPYVPITLPPDAPSTVQVTLEAKARVFFPADSPGATSPSQISSVQTSYPIFVAVHGNSGVATSYLGYDYLLEHMAKNGFIAASIHMTPGMRGRGRAEVLLDHLARLKSKFTIDGFVKAANNIGIMGHSRGGEGVVKAARVAQQTSSPHAINAIIALAPTDQYGRETLVGAWATPLMVIYGSMDGDVSGKRINLPGFFVESSTNPQRTGFSIYDRANGAVKSMHFAYGATHNRFNTTWGTEGGALPNSSELINSDAHKAIAKGYMAAFMRRHLLGEADLDSVMKGEWVPTAVQTADGGKAKIYTQY